MIGKDTVFFITGAAKGMGLEIARKALEKGYRVVATARRPETFACVLPENGRLLTAKLDLTLPGDIEQAVSAALDTFGRIDVLVNNAGYSLLGYFEETSDKQIRQQFETELLRHHRHHPRRPAGHAPPEIRPHRHHHFHILHPLPDSGTLPFRTDFFREGASFVFSDLQIGDYDGRRKKLHAHFTERDGNPVKLAASLIRVLEHDHPPLRLLVSKPAYPVINACYTERHAELRK